MSYFGIPEYRNMNELDMRSLTTQFMRFWNDSMNNRGDIFSVMTGTPLEFDLMYFTPIDHNVKALLMPNIEAVDKETALNTAALWFRNDAAPLTLTVAANRQLNGTWYISKKDTAIPIVMYLTKSGNSAMISHRNYLSEYGMMGSQQA